VKPGSILDGRYRIEKVAGEGGMGTVYRAIDQMFEEPVAIKVLHATTGRVEERFAAEIEILTRLNHPAVVSTIGSGVTPEGKPYMALEWLEGIELAERLESGETLTVEETITMIRRIADGLGVAHRLGVVHRDLKPSNLFLAAGRPDRVKVLDFGVARRMQLERKLTQTGTALGTPQYMSPEQAGGHAVDVRSDVFALGSVMFECLTGRPAYPGETVMAVLTAILLGQPPRLHEFRPDLPDELDTVLAKMMAKEAVDRYPDGHAVSRALATLGSVKGSRPVSEGFKALTLTGQERRFLCIVAVGVNRMTEDADIAETMADLDIEGEVAQLRTVAAMFGARVEELPDGSITATLDTIGAPQQQVERAARCALRLREQVADSPIVLVSGWGNLADASALQAFCDHAVAEFQYGTAEGVLVEDETSQLLSERFVSKPHDRGVVLLREEATPTQARKVLGKATTCVGRARELAMLETTFVTCAEEGESSAIIVSAPPGMGKSRVLVELLGRVKANEPDTIVLYTRGDEISAGGALGVLRPAIRTLAGLSPADPAAEQLDQLRKRVDRYVEDDPETTALFLAEIAGVPLDDGAHPQIRAARRDPALMAQQMRNAFINFLASEAREEVVLIAIDDLQWGDDPSVKYIDSLLEETEDDEDASLMVVAMGRPEMLKRFPGLWKDRGVAQIELGRLSNKAARKLVRQVLGDTAAPQFIRSLAERSEGNPYYLEELIRAAARAPDDSTDLPRSILGMVQARLDKLESDTRLALRAGSIFGPVFWGSAVAHLLGGSGRSVAASDALEAALAAEFIRIEETSAFADEVAYSFSTLTVREAAYAMLTEEDKALGHSLAAEWLEDRGVNDALVLAEHHERGGNSDKAAAWYLEAAVDALEANDMPKVLDLCSRGEATGVTSEVLGHLKVLEAEACEWAGDADRAENAAELALDLLPVGSERWFHAAGNLMIASCRMGWTDDASRRVEAMIGAESRDDDARARKVVALCRGALNAMWTGRYPLARQQGISAEATEKPLRELWPLALARLKHAEAYWNLHRGLPGTAIPLFLQAAKAWELAGDRRSLTGVRTNIGFVYGLLGQYEEAEMYLTEQAARAQELGLTPLYHVCRHNLATVLAQRGDVDAAIEMKEPAVTWLARAGHPRLDGNVIASLGHVLLSVGRLDEALDRAEFAAAMLPPFPPTHAYALGVSAAALVAMERYDEALERAKQGMEILQELGGTEEGEALLRLAHVEALFGVGDDFAAKMVLNIAVKRLHVRADSITDPIARSTFLSAVPENEKTLMLYELKN